MSDWVEMRQSAIGQSLYDDASIGSLEEKRQMKLHAVETAVELRDMDLLQTLAKSRFGLVSASNRRKAWPFMQSVLPSSTEKEGDEEEEAHKDEPQVLLDVNRSFVYYPKVDQDGDDGEEAIQELRKSLRGQLNELIVRVLRRHPKLSYFQGYHDIAQVVLLVFDGQAENAVDFFDTMTCRYLRDFMMPSLNCSLDHLGFIVPLLNLADPYMADLIKPIGRAYYALSSILTLYAHNVENFDDICMIFDYVLASNDMTTPIYLYVALILLKRDIVKEMADDRDVLHSVLSTLPSTLKSSEIPAMLEKATTLRSEYPIHEISNWMELSPYSVLSCSDITPVQVDLIIEKQVDESIHRQIMEQETLRAEREAGVKHHLVKKDNKMLKISAIQLLLTNKSLFGASLVIGITGLVLTTWLRDVTWAGWFKGHWF
ncbi:hypothetical protein TRVA0_001S04038 [Trichomonascus vanleenenianus]|uniref:GTPase-activating protein GYP8 n=1 Tax=Trichomonascus vanleenenianus TaxID=2268995 RepID=UPI003ECAFF73